MGYLDIAQAALRRYRARREMDQPVPPLADPEAMARRARLLAMLREQPGLLYAIATEQMADGSQVIAFANRAATCELLVPAPRDPLAFARDLFALMDRAQCERSEESERRGRT